MAIRGRCFRAVLLRELRRQWRDGDRVEIELPMQTTVERLPDGSDWVALRGPIVLASPAGTNNLRGLYANDSRMGHVAHGPVVPMDQVPVCWPVRPMCPGTSSQTPPPARCTSA
jgi:hypothetical protein